MKCVVEGTANYLIDPRQRYFPTLMEHDPGEIESRMRYLKYCIDVSAELNADCMSMKSGLKPDGLTFEQAMGRLVDGIEELLLYAAERDVVVSIEPEPGMLVDTLGRFDRLLHLFDSPRLMLTLDASHLFCTGELPVAAQLERWQKRIANIHISDVRDGQARHLPFQEGQIGFPLVLQAIAAIEYDFGIHVDLPKHGYDAANMIRQSYNFLSPMIKAAKAKYLDQ
jgi:sugar phosphate isomerase/epimerase